MPQRVRFALLGVGYMGRAAFGALDVLLSRDDVRKKFEIEICVVAEPQESVRERTKEHVNVECQIMQNSKQALAFAIDLAEREHVPTIIYDATSPLERAAHLDVVLEARRAGVPIAIIAEKPIAVTSADLELIRAYEETDDFFCEFIEMGNDAFIALKRYLDENALPIDQIACWRANSSGIRKSLGGGRAGVVGGALLDKAAHDVAIVASLLRIDKAQIGSAVIHHVVPFSNTGWFTIRNDVEYGNDPGRWLGDDVSWPADGTASVTATWGGSWSQVGVPVSFLWGWHGLTGIEPEREFADILKDLGHDRPYTLEHVVDLVAEQKGYSETSGGLCGEDRVFLDDDVRLVVVWSGAHRIVCNLLGKHYKGENARLERYIIDYVNGEKRVVYDPAQSSPDRDLSRINRHDLADIFLRVMQAADDPGQTLDFARKRTEFVHQFVFEAQQKAIRGLASTPSGFESVFDDSINLVRSKLRKQADGVRSATKGDTSPPPIRPA